MGGYADQVNEWLGSLPTQVILTIGNHDDARLMKSLTHVSCTERVRLGGVVCQHEPHDDLGVPCIVGHIHPGVESEKRAHYQNEKGLCHEPVNVDLPGVWP